MPRLAGDDRMGSGAMMENKTDLLLAEYLHLQKVVEDFDARAVTIKAWSVTVSAARLATAYVEAKPMILVIAGMTALTFWIVEALWKANQQAYYPRLKAIEASFEAMKDGTKGADLSPLQITTSWNRDKTFLCRAAGVLWIACWPHVCLPHLPVAIGAFAFREYAPPVAPPDPAASDRPPGN